MPRDCNNQEGIMRNALRALRIGIVVLSVTMLGGRLPSQAQTTDQIRIAAEYGLGYAPLYIVAKKPEFIHKYLPNASISLVQLAGGAAVREALISGTVDVGGLAMSPIIQAWDKGADVKIALGMSFMPTELITYRADIKSVKDLKPGEKVNIVSIGSPQSLEMKMAGEKYYNNPNYFDSSFSVLPHPDAVAALIAKRDIVAEFATPPFIRVLMKQPGMHSILSNHDKNFPDANFMLIVAGASGNFVRNRPKDYDAVMKATKDAIEWLNTRPQEAAAFLAADQGGGKTTTEDWLAEMKQPGVRFSPVPGGFSKLAGFMQRIGATSKLATYDDVTWPNLHGIGGN